MTALREASGPRVHVDDARPTLLGIALVVLPAVIVMVLTTFLLAGSVWLVPVLVAVAAILVGFLVARMARGPTVTRA